MNENAKKVGLVAIIVVALVAAVFGIMQFTSSDKPQVDKVIQIPEGSRSMKDIEMENQAKQQAGQAAGDDMGGSIGGSKDEGLGDSLTPK